MSSRKAGTAGSADVIVIGAGHSGLAVSHSLAARGIDHVVLERGEIANTWRNERWDSLRLLTPNWMSRLPGYRYRGDDPDGYMSAGDVVDFVAGYAAAIDAPVVTRTNVTALRRHDDGYLVATNRGRWACRAVVIASGACNRPAVPALSAALPASVLQVTADRYRNPEQLPQGGALVIGASATGVQLAAEIHGSGRPVTLAVGEHVRMPRLYRGRDVQWWLLATGLLDEGLDQVDDPARVRRLPSPQLVGSADRATLDLNWLAGAGVRIAGRLMGAAGGTVQFSGSLRNVCALADLKLNRLLRSFDDWAERTGAAADVGPPQRYAPTHIDPSPPLTLDLAAAGIRTVVWATGFRPDYSWLDVPVLDRKGQLRHDGGVVDSPGLFVLGLPFMRRRKSSFIHGAEDDARDVAAAIVAHLERPARRGPMTRIAV